MIDPAAIARSTRPRSAGVRPSRALTCGIRDAQLANAKPLPMKTPYVARTARGTDEALASDIPEAIGRVGNGGDVRAPLPGIAEGVVIAPAAAVHLFAQDVDVAGV